MARFTAWFNIYYKREEDGSTALGAMKPLTSDGKAVTLDDIDDLDEDSTLGVGTVEDFSWKGILDFTTCTECGRCQSQCPAWNTEKPLSPKLLITALRDHAYAKHDGDEAHRERQLVGVGSKGETAGSGEDVLDWFYNPADGDFVIDEDVLWSCTSCGACVQQCPVDIEHVDHIMDMRRYQLLVESNFPAELNQLFKGLENKGNPWNMSATARMDWAKGLEFDVPVVGEDLESLESVDWLFWVGCAGAYEDRAKKTTRAVAELLDMAGISFGVLGNGETCTGDPARRAGNEFVFQAWPSRTWRRSRSTRSRGRLDLRPLLQHAQERVQGLRHRARGRPPHPAAQPPGARGQADPGQGGRGRREALDHLPRPVLPRSPQPGLLPAARAAADPAGRRARRDGAQLRAVLLLRRRRRAHVDEENLGERINMNRTKEAVGTGADQIAVGCPFCRVMLSDGLTSQQAKGEAREEVEVLDVAQMLLASVKGEQATKAAPGSALRPRPPRPRPPPPRRPGRGPPPPPDVATKDEPEDRRRHRPPRTRSPSRGTRSGRRRPPAGTSLFDHPADEKPASGGSLFDTPAPEAPAAAEPKAEQPAAEADAKPAGRRRPPRPTSARVARSSTSVRPSRSPPRSPSRRPPPSPRRPRRPPRRRHRRPVSAAGARCSTSPPGPGTGRACRSG